MRLLIVDDEAPARQWMRHLVEDLGPPFEISGEAATGAQAVELCKADPVDVVLMDISMPGLDGLEAAGMLARFECPPAVIFTTAYEEHALQAFDRHAVDYLLKPVRLERLRRALDRARTLSRAHLRALEELRLQSDSQRKHLCSHFRGDLQRIPVDEVIYFRADTKYVVARHLRGEVLLEESLKSLEREFADRFLRVHRSALVSREYLMGVEKCLGGSGCARLRGCTDRIEISRRHLPAVRRWLKQGKDGVEEEES